MVRKEPTEGAATKIPKPCGPTFKISSAKTANKAIAPPNKTENMSKVSAPKIAFVLNTKRTPSFKLCKTGSPILGFKTGFLLILNNTKNEKVTKKNVEAADPSKKQTDTSVPLGVGGEASAASASGTN